MRFREDTPAELEKARTAVASWRDLNPAGNAEQLIAAIGHRFHRTTMSCSAQCYSRLTGTGHIRLPASHFWDRCDELRPRPRHGSAAGDRVR